MRNKKWILIYTVSIITLVVSDYYLTLPIEEQLRLFCAIDNAHVAEPQPTWVYPGYYWANPNTGTKLTVIPIILIVDASTHLYYDYQENIFWIGVQTGPRRFAIYGPYQGILWALTKAIDPLAIIGIALSVIALLYPLMRIAIRNNNRRNPAVQKTRISTSFFCKFLTRSVTWFKQRRSANSTYERFCD